MRKELVVYDKPKSTSSEVFRTLRTNIQFMNVNQKMKTLLITSTFPKEGKSWVTSNLAITFAQAGKKVLLIDADMRKGRQYQIFDIEKKPGLSDFLATTELTDEGEFTENLGVYIQETELNNLQILSSGSVPPNPSELLVSEKTIKLLDLVKGIYDIVIIDGTPCELVSDSIILSRMVDSTLLVAAHKLTKKDAFNRVIKNIKNVEGNIIGVVLNKMPIHSRKYGYTYYYYGESTDKKMKSKQQKKERREKFNNKVEENIAKLKNEIAKSEQKNKQQTKSHEQQNIPENKEQRNQEPAPEQVTVNEPIIQNQNEVPQVNQTMESQTIVNEPVTNQEMVNEPNKIQEEPKPLTKEEEIMSSINEYLKRKGQN